MAAAVAAGFDCVLTRDRLFGESAARALKRFPSFSVMSIAIPQLRGAEFLDHFRRAWRKAPIKPTDGEFLQWPAAQ